MSNKIPCGGFYLDDMLSVNDSGELSIKGGLPYQQLVTDGNGNTRWENKMIVDSELSNTSENPVQNKAVKFALDALGKGLVVDLRGYTLENPTTISDISYDPIYEAIMAGQNVVFQILNESIDAFTLPAMSSVIPGLGLRVELTNGLPINFVNGSYHTTA